MAGWINEVSPSCDRERQPPTKDFGDIIEEWEGGIFVPVDPPEPMPDPDDIWPPKKFPDLGFVDDYLPGGVRPGGLGPLINPGPSIRDLTDDDARGVLESGGYKVGEIIELGKEDSISKLTEIGADKYGVIGSVTPEPGDEVALITRDGLAVEYVVVNRGNGAPVYTAPSLDGKALDKKIDDAIKGIDFTKAIAGADLGALADTGELEGNIRDLATEKDKVRAEVEILRSEKDTLLSDVENMRTVLDGLETSRKAISTEIEKTIKVQDEFKAEMRLDQPIEAVLEGNTNAINKLKARGLVSVRDLQDQPTGTLTTLLRNTGLTGSTLKSTISNFRNR